MGARGTKDYDFRGFKTWKEKENLFKILKQTVDVIQNYEVFWEFAQTIIKKVSIQINTS